MRCELYSAMDGKGGVTFQGPCTGHYSCHIRIVCCVSMRTGGVNKHKNSNWWLITNKCSPAIYMRPDSVLISLCPDRDSKSVSSTSNRVSIPYYDGLI